MKPTPSREEYEESERSIEHEQQLLRRRMEDDSETIRQIPRLYRETDDGDVPPPDSRLTDEAPPEPI